MMTRTATNTAGRAAADTTASTIPRNISETDSAPRLAGTVAFGISASITDTANHTSAAEYAKRSACRLQ